MGSGDVIEDDLVRTLLVVFSSAFHRVSDLTDTLEIHALDDFAVTYIETGNDSFCEHNALLYSLTGLAFLDCFSFSRLLLLNHCSE